MLITRPTYIAQIREKMLQFETIKIRHQSGILNPAKKFQRIVDCSSMQPISVETRTAEYSVSIFLDSPLSRKGVERDQVR